MVKIPTFLSIFYQAAFLFYQHMGTNWIFYHYFRNFEKLFEFDFLNNMFCAFFSSDATKRELCSEVV